MTSSERAILRPLTVLVLGAAPAPRVLWIVVWALVPWLNAAAYLALDLEDKSAVWEQSNVLIVLSYASMSVAVIVTLFGAAEIARRVEGLGQSMPGALPSGWIRSFAQMNSLGGPLVAASLTCVVFGAGALAHDGWTAAVVRSATWFVLGIAIWTFLWTYGSLQLGLHRLGRFDLLRNARPVDPGLGLRPAGDVAFMGLWMLLVALVPPIVTGLPDVVGFSIGILVLAAGVGGFFVSLFGLHRQMAVVKERELTMARDLYRQAYEPLRAAPTLETLGEQSGLLGAADSLEKRARAIHDWPIDEATWAWVIGIATSVVAITVARLLLRPLGL